MAEPRHFLDIDGVPAETLAGILRLAHAMKRAGRKAPHELRPDAIDGAVLAMIFECPSTRTRVSFDVAMRQLGGETVVLNRGELQLGRGESISDTAQVLSRYVDAIMLRTASHEALLELASHASVPVINGLTNLSHPCQVIADLMTFEESHGAIGGRGQVIAWVGDANNVAASWVHAAVRLGFAMRIACPGELAPDGELMNWVRAEGGDVQVTRSPREAARGADCIITDTWVSMADEDGARRMALLEPYRVDGALMAEAGPEAIFMHCLPAYRGREVTAEVIDGPQSVVFDEAENRLHAQKAILAWCFGAGLLRVGLPGAAGFAILAAMTNTPDRLRAVFDEIDAANADDPRSITVAGSERPFEHVYSERMAEILGEIYPEASELLRIAAHAQHIRRWDVARADYAEGREGYNKWRRACRAHHGEVIAPIMARHGYGEAEIAHVTKLIRKEQLRKDKESQALENVVDVVFLKYYWDDFQAKFRHYDDDKLIDIIGKTLRKMSPRGHRAALALDLPEETRRLVLAAVEREAETLARLAENAPD